MNAIRTAAVAIMLLTPHLASAQEPTILKHDGWVAAVAFAPDGKTLASAGADNVVRLWEVGTWKPKGMLRGHTDCVCALAFTESWLVTGSFDQSVKVWQLQEPAPLTSANVKKEREPWPIEKVVREVKTTKDGTFGGCVTAVAASQLGPSLMLITGSVDTRLSVGGIEKKDHAWSYRHKSWVNGIAFNWTAGREWGIASASSDGTVGIHHITESGWKTIRLEGGAGEVRCVAFSPDGKLLAAGNRYGTVRIWDVAEKKELKTITGHMGDVWSIAFSPDGKTLAAVDTDWKKSSKIKLYDTVTWKERGALDTPGEILSIAYSPKGDWLAAGCWDKTVRIFKLEPGAK